MAERSLGEDGLHFLSNTTYEQGAKRLFNINDEMLFLGPDVEQFSVSQAAQQANNESIAS